MDASAPRWPSVTPSAPPTGVSAASARSQPAVDQQDRREDPGDDKQFASTAAVDRRPDDEEDERRRQEHAHDDLEQEPRGQADGGSGSPAPKSAGLPRMRRSAHAIGSYVRDTMRSFSGMIALSVMWMSSGHTSVQHLVMLQ